MYKLKTHNTADLADVDFEDIDDLLNKLTPEELDQLNDEVDPDV
jgi:hypothetical protein